MFNETTLINVSAICRIEVLKDGSLHIVLSNSDCTYTTSVLTTDERLDFFYGLSLTHEEAMRLEQTVNKEPAR